MNAARRQSKDASAPVQVAAVAALVLIGLARWADVGGGAQERAVSAGMTPSGLLAGGDAAGFERATTVRPFVFPDDHGPHPDFRTEWWYFTGNLGTTTAPARHFGFQLTFFRFALSPDTPAGTSPWRSRQTYMAHFAVTDSASGKLIAAEQFGRDALNLAGAQASPFRVWLGDWEAASHTDTFLPLSLNAQAREFAIALELERGKPKVLQGEAGLSRKSAEPGNASYYYSYTRLPSAGEIRIGEESYRVNGQAWMDREWSTSALAPGTEGWDWFALQLDDGSDLMFYRLRGQDGSTGPQSGGVLVGADGAPERLFAGDVQLSVKRRWTSPRTDVSYPVAWRVHVPAQNLDLEVTPRIDDQELNLSVVYWEGAVEVAGSRNGQSLRGEGYLELAGYAR